MENQRKRQLGAPNAGAPIIKKEPVDFDEQIAKTVLESNNFPILTSMISAPPKTAAQKAPALNYMMVFSAFHRFLNAYMEAGGDAHLVSTLTSFTTSLPMPPNPLKPLSSSFGFVAPTEKIVVKTEPIFEKQENPEKSEKPIEKQENIEQKPVPSLHLSPTLPLIPRLLAPPTQPPVKTSTLDEEVTSEIQRLREAAFGRYKNVLCVICNEWICSRNRKNHIEAHLNYRPYKCSACEYARRREIFVVQHIKTQHKGHEGVHMISNVDLNVAIEVDRLADECVARTRKLIESMQEKKDGDFGENKDFDEKAAELMMAEEAEKKVVVIESVSEVRAKVANYHRRQRTRVLKKIYDTDVAKGAQLKIVKEDEVDEAGPSQIGLHVEEGFEIKLEDLMAMIAAEEQKEQPETEKAADAPLYLHNIQQELSALHR